MIEFTDGELGVLYEMFSDWVQSSDYWEDEDQGIKSLIFERVGSEAKRRGLWWAR